MKETANDMWSQWNTVNGAFEQRVYETNEAKEKIQNHLNAVNKIMYPLIEKTHSLSLSYNRLFKKYSIWRKILNLLRKLF
jgi:hypothetical protein